MAIFSVANQQSDTTVSIIGLSFCPSDPGPNGNGPPATATVTLISVSLGYSTYDTADRAGVCLIYGAPLGDPSEIGQPGHLVGTSSGNSDSSDGVGYTRTFAFDDVKLETQRTYYVYFSGQPQTVLASSSADYASGSVWNFDGDEDHDLTAVFQVDMFGDDSNPPP